MDGLRITAYVVRIGSPRQSDFSGDRRDGQRQDHADDSVPGRGGLHLQGEDRLHAAAPCGSHERCQARQRRVWMPPWRGGA
eukprot:scaffold200267_cov31-Prasinocladus_malaysianus.AAC.2